MSSKAGQARITRNQQLVLECLAANSTPMSAYAILDRVREQGIRAPLQVYRALDKLIALGRVHKVESLNAFVACAHRHRSHSTAFAICDHCKSVLEFTLPGSNKTLSSWARKTEFTVDNTCLEIHGRCSDCTDTESG